ncbi:ABC transporter permease [Sciscionella sediminilitoris]|uniref:ABC transporter permease n=1 Tax=Sciscionella sediminilitoris TaxID=1445613 RepID=UPI0004DEDF65|nr:ABC transporter permease [Sciscionella sp. SE31]
MNRILPAILAVIFAVLLCSVALLISGDDPVAAFATMITQVGEGQTAVNVINTGAVYFIAGLAVAIGFKMNLFNIGIEGQYRFAVIVAAIYGGSVHLPPGIHTLTILLVAAVAGALYALIPALLKAYRGVSEVISTIMLNSIVAGITGVLVKPDMFGVQSGNNLATAAIPPSGRVPGIPLGSAGTLFGLVFLAVLLGVGYWFMLGRTRFGFELQASGESATAAAAGGVNARRMVLIAMLLSGAVAGLIAMPELLGRDFSYGINAPQGYGFTGIAVALIGRNSPTGIAIGALLWSFLDKSAVSLDNIGVSREIVTIMQGVIVLSVVVAYEIFRRRELKTQQQQVGTEFLSGKTAGGVA